MIQKIKSFFINTHNACVPSFIANDKRKRIIFLVAFYLLFASTFLTIFGQIPFFSSRGLTKLFQIGWVLVLVPLLMLDYKQLIKSLLKTSLLLLPFLLYCLVALCFKIYSISYSGTIVIFLSSFILFIGVTFSKYKTETSLKFLLFGYLCGAFLYAGIVYFAILRGYDLDNQIYAFGDKNSAGPIFMAAAIIAYYLFSKRQPFQIACRWLIISFFIIIIALSKNRAVLVIIPFIILPMIFVDIKSRIVSLIIIFLMVAGITLIFAVPQLYEVIIIKILFNSKTNIDEIFSGRLSQIVENIQNLNPVFGNGGNYFDCMPVSFLCSYGLLGIISLLPMIIKPFWMFMRVKKNINKRLFVAIVLLSMLYILTSLFEGFGYFGPGAKSFILWFTAGLFSSDLKYNNRTAIHNTIDRTIQIVVNVFDSKYLITFIELSLLTLSNIFLFSNNTLFNIGDIVIDKLPTTNEIANYIEIQDNTIDAPVNTMCVGQKITFKTKATPYDAYDKIVQWSTGWIDNPPITVNSYSGEVFAYKGGTALLNINRFRVGPNGIYIQFPVLRYEEYDFDKLYISSKPFSSSFSNTENDIININNNCTAKLFYDNFYLPKMDDFSFISSNINVATVDNNGVISAHNPGTCIIKGILKNSYNNESINYVTINVMDRPFVSVSSFDVDYSKTCYQYEPYEILPIFNDDASDKKITIDVNGLKYEQRDNQLIFTEFGTAFVTVSSQNNPSYKKSFELEIKENPPVKFECKTKRLLIGEMKNARELGLMLIFKNGYKKIITDDDILFDSIDFSNRAWTDRNGLTGNNRTTIYAVKKGTIRLSYVSRIDQNIKGTFNITCSAYTAEEYSYLCNGTGVIALSFVLLIALTFSLFVNIQRKWILFALLTATTGSFITITFLLYGISPFTIIPAIVNLIALITAMLLRVILKNRFPLKFLEEPAEYTPTISDIKIDENITI